MITVKSYKDIEKILDRPGVLKIGASWCATCREAQPTYERLESTYGNQVKFFMADVDECEQALIDRYNVDEMPVFVYITANGEFATQDLEELESKIKNNLQVRGVHYHTRKDVEELCARHGKDIKDFDKFMYGQGAPYCDWEEDPACYFCSDVARFLGI